MFPDESYKEQLQLLEKVLKRSGFRFVIIGQNHRDIFIKIKTWLREKFPHQKISAIEIFGKDYRSFMDEIKNLDDAWILIPDFDKLFDKEHEIFCTALNQRRDYFARNNKVLICFLFEENLKLVPAKTPDLWSLRTLELSFEINLTPALPVDSWMTSSSESNTLGGSSLSEKRSEIERLLAQLKVANPDEKQLLVNIHQQLGRIYFSISEYQKALFHFENSLKINREIGDEAVEGLMLNNISQIYRAKGDYQLGLEYLKKSLNIRQQIGDKVGEGFTLNNIGQIYSAWGDYKTAKDYLEKSLKIWQEIGDRLGEATSLNNLAAIAAAQGNYQLAQEYLEKSLNLHQGSSHQKGEGDTLNNLATIAYSKGDFQTALEYFEKSLSIMQEIGDKTGESVILNNIGQIHNVEGDFETALEYFEKSLIIQHEIGDNAGMIPTLHNLALIALKQENVELYRKYHTQAWQMAWQTQDAIGLFQVGKSFGFNLCRFGDLKNGLDILKIVYTKGQQSGLPGTEEIGALIKEFETDLNKKK